MALDARHRSSLYTKLVPLLGEDDANALMSEFERFHQQTLWLGGAIAAWTGLLAALTRLT